MIPTKRYAIQLVLLPAIEFIHQQDLIGLALKIGSYLDVEKPFSLKIVNEVALAFLHQVGIDCSFRVNGDELPYLPLRHEWKRR